MATLISMQLQVMFIRKKNGTWDKIGNIRGPQGLKVKPGCRDHKGYKDLRVTRVLKDFKVVMVKTEHKVYQDATDVMAQQVVTDVMDATVKTS